MKIDLLFDPFGATWTDVREAAWAADEAGFDGVRPYDHLAGSVHGENRVLEAWTTLTAIAATVPRIAIGPMVLNVANRAAGPSGRRQPPFRRSVKGACSWVSVPAVVATRRTRQSSGPSTGRCRVTRHGARQSRRQW